MYVIIKYGVLESKFPYGSACMKNGGVVAASKGITNFWQAAIGEFSSKPHCHLTWSGNGTVSAL